MTVILYTGNGPGKTTAALGIALRTLGHDGHVVIIQFMKWWKNTGEYLVAKKIRRNYEIHQFGRKGWRGLKNLTEEDRRLAMEGLKLAEKILKKRKPDLLILDEINLAAHCGLLTTTEIVKFLNKIPRKTTVVLTGRHAPKQLLRVADIVTTVKAQKLPKKLRAIKGVNF